VIVIDADGFPVDDNTKKGKMMGSISPLEGSERANDSEYLMKVSENGTYS
jgi:hypothetical protein